MPRVDEKSQMQALDRTQPTLPMQPSLPRRRTNDYVCRCTTTLFAALEVATGKVTGICQEFLRFLSSMSRAYPDQELHLVMDNYAAHKRIEFRQWLTDNPRIRVPFHPPPPHLGVLAQSGRGLVWHHRMPSHTARHLRQRPRTDDGHPHLHHRMEQARPPVRRNCIPAAKVRGRACRNAIPAWRQPSNFLRRYSVPTASSARLTSRIAVASTLICGGIAALTAALT